MSTDTLLEQRLKQHASLINRCAWDTLGSTAPQNGVGYDDLVQVGRIAIVKAHRTFDLLHGVKFVTYAKAVIEREMRHELRDFGATIREAGNAQESRARYYQAQRELHAELNREPTTEEIAARVGEPVKRVKRILDHNQGRELLSVDEWNMDNWDESLHDDGVMAGQVEARAVVRDALRVLEVKKPKQYEAVRLFYFGDCTKTEIAQQLGISVNYAVYLVKHGVKELHTIVDAGGWL